MSDPSPVVDDQEDLLTHEEESDGSEIDRVLPELQARCKGTEVRLEIEEFDSEKYIRVHLPAGRDTVPIVLYGAERLKRFLSIPFERYVLLGDYAAYCSYTEGFIEAGISFLAPGSARTFYRQLSLDSGEQVDDREQPAPVRIANPAGNQALVVGPSTTTLEVLGGLAIRPGRPSLRIEGLTISRFEQAVEILERIANSLFFQLDMTRDMPLALSRRRRPASRGFRSRTRHERTEIEFPKSEYDRDPVSLYWYARSATGMPLLQFLAYYQAIEYYFPTYSQAEARRKIRNILKNPAFRPDRDNDLARILVAVRASGQGYGDERSQLRATLNECVEPGALREFLTNSPEREKFFTSKTEGLTDHKIPIRNPDADLRNDVADRLYDIRCKIVHTKSGGRDGEMDLLLPFSKEAELLYADIELIQFVAREVLVSASTTLRL